MAQFPIQTGVRVENGSFRTSYPTNLRHKIVESGLSQGQLVSTHGAREVVQGPGRDRGGINWDNVHYRVLGGQLCRLEANGAIGVIGDVGSDGLACQFSYGFDRLGIRSNDRLFYYDGASLTEVTDTDLGPVIDVTWIDGYFVTSDGTSIVVTELNDPTSVDPLKYGSAESDPDAVTGIDVLREELVVFGNNSIQFMQNVGGNGFPFRNVRGAMIPTGCISARAKCRIVNTIAFVGNGREEPLGVYLIAQGGAVRISDEAIDALLAEGDPNAIAAEARRFGDEEQLVIHTATRSAAIMLRASQQADTSLWHYLDTDGAPYRPRNAVLCYGKHWVGDGQSNAIGVLDEGISAHFGVEPGWAFDAGLLYNDGRAFVLREVEITGQFPQAEQAVFFSLTREGELWSREVSRIMDGRRSNRVLWRPNTRMQRIAGMRFRGHGKVAIARGDVEAEALSA